MFFKSQNAQTSFNDNGQKIRMRSTAPMVPRTCQQYVNAWRRLARGGRSFYSCFFFNDGSLNRTIIVINSVCRTVYRLVVSIPKARFIGLFYMWYIYFFFNLIFVWLKAIAKCHIFCKQIENDWTTTWIWMNLINLHFLLLYE